MGHQRARDRRAGGQATSHTCEQGLAKAHRVRALAAAPARLCRLCLASSGDVRALLTLVMHQSANASILNTQSCTKKESPPLSSDDRAFMQPTRGRHAHALQVQAPPTAHTATPVPQRGCLPGPTSCWRPPQRWAQGANHAGGLLAPLGRAVRRPTSRPSALCCWPPPPSPLLVLAFPPPASCVTSRALGASRGRGRAGQPARRCRLRRRVALVAERARFSVVAQSPERPSHQRPGWAVNSLATARASIGCARLPALVCRRNPEEVPVQTTDGKELPKAEAAPNGRPCGAAGHSTLLIAAATAGKPPPPPRPKWRPWSIT